MPPEKSPGPKYLRPPPHKARNELPGQQALLVPGTSGIPDPTLENRRKASIRSRLAQIKQACQKNINAINLVEVMLARGVTLPDIAEALGLPPPIDRVTKPAKPWRLQPGSNMDIIAGMLETAGVKGVSEGAMVAHLLEIGRLTGAKKPRRAVHYTVTELQRRTRFITRKSNKNEGRSYAYGPLDMWRSNTHN